MDNELEIFPTFLIYIGPLVYFLQMLKEFWDFECPDTGFSVKNLQK